MKSSELFLNPLSVEMGVPQSVPYLPQISTPDIARALHLTTDELLGVTPVKKTGAPRNKRLQRRLEQIEQLHPTEKRQVLQVLDAFIERGKLKKKVSTG